MTADHLDYERNLDIKKELNTQHHGIHIKLQNWKNHVLRIPRSRVTFQIIL
jgi:hypothetical protein